MTDAEKIQTLQKAIELIKEMGAIIRYLDTENVYCEFWLNDGSEHELPYVPKSIDLGIIN